MIALYKHKKSGKQYRLLKYGLMESDQSEVAIYQSVEDKRVWVRPTREFHENFELYYEEVI